MKLKTQLLCSAAEDQPAKRNQADHRVHPLLQPEKLNDHGTATDAGDHGTDQSCRPFARRVRRGHHITTMVESKALHVPPTSFTEADSVCIKSREGEDQPPHWSADRNWQGST